MNKRTCAYQYSTKQHLRVTYEGIGVTTRISVAITLLEQSFLTLAMKMGPLAVPATARPVFA